MRRRRIGEYARRIGGTPIRRAHRLYKQVTDTPQCSTLHYGGKGGYSTGIVNLTSPTDLYIYVGGTGDEIPNRPCIGGGFNGDRNASGQSNSWSCGGGGGASDIRIATDSLYSRLIVAGGGGGWLVVMSRVTAITRALAAAPQAEKV